MVAGNHHHPAVADHGAELVEERTRDLDRGRERHIAQLDDVAQQDHLVGTLELGPELLPEFGPAQQVDPAARGEVDVGEQDSRSHNHQLTCLCGANANDAARLAWTLGTAS